MSRCIHRCIFFYIWYFLQQKKMWMETHCGSGVIRLWALNWGKSCLANAAWRRMAVKSTPLCLASSVAPGTTSPQWRCRSPQRWTRYYLRNKPLPHLGRDCFKKNKTSVLIFFVFICPLKGHSFFNSRHSKRLQPREVCRPQQNPLQVTVLAKIHFLHHLVARMLHFGLCLHGAVCYSGCTSNTAVQWRWWRPTSPSSPKGFVRVTKTARFSLRTMTFGKRTWQVQSKVRRRFCYERHASGCWLPSLLAHSSWPGNFR